MNQVPNGETTIPRMPLRTMAATLEEKKKKNCGAESAVLELLSDLILFIFNCVE